MGIPLVFYLQPFSKLNYNEADVKKAESATALYRCKRCKSYINKWYNRKQINERKVEFTCNLCECSAKLEDSQGVNQRYYTDDRETFTEFIDPAVDFPLPEALDKKYKFIDFVFLIELSTSFLNTSEFVRF